MSRSLNFLLCTSLLGLGSCGSKVSFSGRNEISLKQNVNASEQSQNDSNQVLMESEWKKSFQLGDFEEKYETLSVPSEPMQIVTLSQSVDVPRSQSIEIGSFAEQGMISVERIKRFESAFNTLDNAVNTRPIDIFITIANRAETTSVVRDRIKFSIKRTIEKLYDNTNVLRLFISGLYDSSGLVAKGVISKQAGKTSQQAQSEVDAVVDSIFSNPSTSNQIFNSQYKLQTYAQTPPSGPNAQAQWNGSRLFMIFSDQSNCTLADGSADPTCDSSNGIHTPYGLQNLGTGAEPNDLYMPVHAVFAASFPISRTCTNGNPDASLVNQFESQAFRSEKFKYSVVGETIPTSSTTYISDICSSSPDTNWIDNATRDVLEIAKHRRNVWRDFVDSMAAPNDDLNFKIYSLNSDGSLGSELVRGKDYFLPNKFPVLSPKVPKGLYKLVYHMTYDPSKGNLHLPATSYDLPTRVAMNDSSFEVSYGTQVWKCPIQNNFDPDGLCRIGKGSGANPDKIYFKNFSFFPIKIKSGMNETISFRHGKNLGFELTLPNARQIISVTRNNESEPNTIERLQSGLKVKIPPSSPDGTVTIHYLDNSQIQQEFVLPALPARQTVQCYKGTFSPNSFRIKDSEIIGPTEAEKLSNCRFESGKLHFSELLPMLDGARKFTVAFLASLEPRSEFRTSLLPFKETLTLSEGTGLTLNDFRLIGDQIILNRPLTQGKTIAAKYKVLPDSSRCVTLPPKTPKNVQVQLNKKFIDSKNFNVNGQTLCVLTDAFIPGALLSLHEVAP